MEWILQGVISLKFFFFSRSSYSKLPFNINISNESASTNNYLGLFISLGIVVFICLMCSFCFYKCSKIMLENAERRRIDQRRRPNGNIINVAMNLNLNEEDVLRKSNEEILNKLLQTDLKPMKYNENINHFHTNCTICLEEFHSSTEVIFLFCKHIFHFSCLKDWLDKNILLPKCPNCNYNVLTGGIIDLNPNNNNNYNNNNGDMNLIIENQLINVNRNVNNNTQNNISRDNNQEINQKENNIINVNIRNNENNIDNLNIPNYIELRNNNNENHRINNLISQYEQAKIDLYGSPNFDLNNNNSKEIDMLFRRQNINDLNNSIENKNLSIQKSNQNIIDNINTINAIENETEKDVLNMSASANQVGSLKKIQKIPPPNKPLSKIQDKHHNNFIINQQLIQSKIESGNTNFEIMNNN